ncbi:uncharacterized protein LOC132745685 isoform X2 [Ruditapes philippinarum]|uniref:uncharacterized protein LOC132745685 isoform X2 n=1 Tax=Ruditapes philippinarum TaxID=129788 RepID=UPI00295B54E4|nr:uncharacterized protein LOC132745685 isoform X2 [Ruditapes philippinarum]
MKEVLLVILAIVCSVANAVSDNEDDMPKRLSATESLVQELLHEVNLLKSQDKHRQKKVLYLEKELRLQRQRSSNLEKIVKKITVCEREQVKTDEKAATNKEQDASTNRIRRHQQNPPLHSLQREMPIFNMPVPTKPLSLTPS